MIPRRYIFVGFENDDKPVDVLPGTLYADWRTGKVYIFTGGEWIEYGASTTTVTETTSDNKVTVRKSGNIIEVKDENGNMIYSSNYFSDAMSAAVAYAEENGLYVYIDEGTYQVDDNSVTVIDADGQQAYILIASRVAIKGAGKGKTIIELSSNYLSSLQPMIIGIISPVIEDLTFVTGSLEEWQGVMLLMVASLGFSYLGFSFNNTRLKNVNVQGDIKVIGIDGSNNLVEDCDSIELFTISFGSMEVGLTLRNSKIEGNRSDIGISGSPIYVDNCEFSGSELNLGGEGIIKNSKFSGTYYISTSGWDLLTIDNCEFTGNCNLNKIGIWPLIVRNSTFDCDTIVLEEKVYFNKNWVKRCSSGYIDVPNDNVMISDNLIKDCTVYIRSSTVNAVAVVNNIFYMNGSIPSHSQTIIEGNVKFL